MNCRRWLYLPLLAAVLLMPGCRRTEDGVRIEGDRAAQEMRDAGERGAEALDDAGARIEQAANDLERRAQPLVEDATITAKVKAKLAADPEVRAYEIDVDTLEHVVTLSGRVETAEIRSEAEKLTRGTEGVLGVRNNLLVGAEQAPVTQPPS
jgi:hyperosmotically inducible periplasmic protein